MDYSRKDTVKQEREKWERSHREGEDLLHQEIEIYHEVKDGITEEIMRWMKETDDEWMKNYAGR